jgi:hypothetical protein
LLTVIDFNAASAKLNMVRGVLWRRTAAGREGALAKLAPDCGGAIFSADFGGGGARERTRTATKSSTARVTSAQSVLNMQSDFGKVNCAR